MSDTIVEPLPRTRRDAGETYHQCQPLVFVVDASRAVTDLDGSLVRVMAAVVGALAHAIPTDALRRYLGQVILDPAVTAAHLRWFWELADRPTVVDGGFAAADIESLARDGLQRVGEGELKRLVSAPKALVGIRAAVHRFLEQGEAHAWHEALLELADRYDDDAEAEPDDVATAVGKWDEAAGWSGSISELQVCHAYNRRMHQEADALATLAALSVTEWRAVASRLRRIVEASRTAPLPRFVAFDAQFHAILTEAGQPALNAADACRFLHQQDYREPLCEERRATVVAEHEAVVAALEAGDFERAAAAARAHLLRARDRRLPNLSRLIEDENRAYFAGMTGGDGELLLVSAVNVSPVEIDECGWDPAGPAIAAAVARGGTFAYLRPAKRMLKRWRKQGLSELALVSEGEMRWEFHRFRERLTDAVASATGDRLSAAKTVAERVSQFHVDSDRWFVLTRPNATLGYLLTRDGREVFTQRSPLDDGIAWRLIEKAVFPKTARDLFFITIRATLARYVRDNPDAPDAMAARRIADRWFSPAAAAQPHPVG